MTLELDSTVDEAGKAHYRDIFDSSVFNFGDYNILVALGVASCDGQEFLIGYRQAPRELLVCPLTADHSPEQLIQIADMDIAQAIVDPNSLAVGIITTQGRTLEFTVPPLVRSTSTGTEWQLDQSLDVADFLEFMRIFESELA